MNEKILIVDDEVEIADLVEVYLKNDGYQVYKFYNGTDALDCVEREKHLFPIIMLTAKVGDMDKITGLTLGADDYITKPFNPLELMARVKTQLRRFTRYNQADSDVRELEEIDVRGLHISKKSHKCKLNGKELTLTPIEFDILWYLCEHRGSVVSSEELFEAVWKEQYLDNNNTVMAHIARLREKLQEPARKPKYVKTVWGVGYTIEN